MDMEGLLLIGNVGYSTVITVRPLNRTSTVKPNRRLELPEITWHFVVSYEILMIALMNPRDFWTLPN